MEIIAPLNFDSVLILIGLSAFAYLTWQNQRHGLYLIVAALPGYLIRYTVFGVPTTLLECLILLLFVLWLLKDNKWKSIHIPFLKKLPVGKVNNAVPPLYRAALGLLLVSAFIAMMISPNTLRAASQFKAFFLEPIMVLLVMVYELKNQKHIEHIAQLLGLTTIVIGVIAIWQHYTGLGIPNPFWANLATRRITTFLEYPNANALFVGPVVAFYIGYLYIKSPLQLTAYKIIVITLGLLTILSAASAGALAGLAVAGLVLLFRFPKTRIIGFCLILIAITWLAHSPTAHEYGAKVLNSLATNHLDLQSSSLEIRMNQWRETLTMLRDHSLFGAGLAGYQQTLKPYHTYSFLEIYLYPHNIILNVWSELGLLGLAAFGLLGAALIQSLSLIFKNKKQKPWAWCLLLIWIVILVHGLVDVPYFKNDLSVLTMLFIGITIVLQNEKKASQRIRTLFAKE